MADAPRLHIDKDQFSLICQKRCQERAQVPYMGYYFRILTGQGASAPAGARRHLDQDGRMVNGFALVA